MSETVSVASKLPHGLRLQLQQQKEVLLPVMGGGVQKTKVFERYGDVVVLKGAAKLPIHGGDHRIECGFAITSGVDEAFFTEWLKQNADHPAVKGGFIFASTKIDDVVDHANAGRDVLSGFEPTDPKNLPDEFKEQIATAA